MLEKNWEYNGKTYQLFRDFEKAYDLVRKEKFHSILIEFGRSMELGRLIKIFLNETYIKVHIDKNLSDTILIQNGPKQGDELSPLIFNFTLNYAMKKVQEDGVGLEMNGIYQLLLYADRVRI